MDVPLSFRLFACFPAFLSCTCPFIFRTVVACLPSSSLPLVAAVAVVVFLRNILIMSSSIDDAVPTGAGWGIVYVVVGAAAGAGEVPGSCRFVMMWSMSPKALASVGDMKLSRSMLRSMTSSGWPVCPT